MKLPHLPSPISLENSSHITSITQTFSIPCPWRRPRFQPSSMGATSNKMNHLQSTRDYVIMGSKSSKFMVSTSSMEPLYMPYLSRRCNQKHKNICPIHPISPEFHNAPWNTYGQIKENSSWSSPLNKQTTKSDASPSGPTCNSTWWTFKNIQKWDRPFTKWISPPSPTNVHE